MTRYSTYRFLLFLCIFIFILSLSGCNTNEEMLVSNISSTLPTHRPSATVTPVPTTVPTTGEDITPIKNDPRTLYVRGHNLSLGESSDSVIKKLGSPGRIVPTEYNFDFYIYNNDYSRLLFIAIDNKRIVGFYSDSIDFNYNGVCSGSTIETVNKVLNSSFTVEAVLSKDKEDYTLHILMDTIRTHKVTGIYILPNNGEEPQYTDEVINNIEYLVYDLTNSIRVRNKEDILSWSSSAALSSKKHSTDMADNNYFSHKDLADRTPGDRMKSEGIYYTSCGENIIAGYGGAIISTHGWFNSMKHRILLLHSNFRYLGVGFVYQEDSTYKTYITQNFYH